MDAGQYPSLVAMFEESFAKHRNANAHACMDKKLTYAQLDEMSRALGAWLQGKGLQLGDRVAIMMPSNRSCPRPTSARCCAASCATPPSRPPKKAA